MKIRIEIASELPEEEIIIHCRQMDARMQRIEKFLQQESAPLPALTFYKQNEEYYFPLDDVLFFETEGDRVFAHTAQDTFHIPYRLYELLDFLPRQFVRAAKGAILNVRHIYSIQKNIASSSLVQFAGSHKQVYISRLYYKQCKQRLEDERRNL